MGSFNGNGRGRGQDRHRGGRGRRQSSPRLESLEGRVLLSGDPPRWQPTSSNPLDVKNGPLAKAGQDLITVYGEYQQFLQNNRTGQFVSSLSKQISFVGTYVGVDVRGFGGTAASLGSLSTQLQGLGMQVRAADVKTSIVEGIVPIGQLPAVAALSSVVGIDPIYKPIFFNQGKANDQGEQVMLADAAKQQFGVNGAGVTVGVISDSANEFQGGLATSIGTGDLPPISRINVLQDAAPNTSNTDEGRAMMEDIFDVAPGANLAFSTATGGITATAQAVRNLATQAGAGIIVDDVGFPDEPTFQDSVISQAISDVTANQNVAYFSATGNQANKGFAEPFQGTNATVTGVGAGRFMNFNPNSGQVTTLLPITVNQAGDLFLQWDNPFYTSNGVTTDLDIFVLDANGNVVASATSNNIASQIPLEDVVIPNAGTFNVAIRVNAGSPDPGRIDMYEFNSDIDFSKQFGNAGGIFYPTALGHNAGSSTIGVGAVPWFNAPPFGTQSPLKSEDFSSFGPVIHEFDPAGNRIGTQTLLRPDVSGPDGNNTSFFGSPPGSVPAGLPANNYSLPNFYGTSDAAPNVAAVGALMKQLSPSTTSDQIRQALINSTLPLNGAAKGAYDPQGGFGLVQATSALQAVDNLRVISTVPAQGQTLGFVPGAIVFNLSKAVNPATLQASDLQITGAPAGVAVTVGNPIFNPANPKVVAFPIGVNFPLGVVANGVYSYTLTAGSISATDGKPLIGFSSSFGVNDATAPRVVNTQFVGRIVVVNFSEPVKPDTITRSSLELVRTGSSGVFNNPTNVLLNNDPRLGIFYDAANKRAIIDLTQLDQSELPADTYALVVADSITDLVGNRLDGEDNPFNVIFPSGNGVPGGTFIQVLPSQALTPPQIAGVALGPLSDTGIAGDNNTNLRRPTIRGRISSNFPGAVSGVAVVAEFNALHGGVFDLRQGTGGRGFAGGFDVSVTTDANGNFAFQPPADLPDGFNSVRLVAVGASDQPPLPGFSSTLDTSFRVDTTDPVVVATSIQPGSTVGSLRGITLAIGDPVQPSDVGNPLAVPIQFNVPALNPATATNINNYSLVRVGAPGTTGSTTQDFSSSILTATYTDTTGRKQTGDAFTGHVDLTFAPNLPAGRYVLTARSPQPGFQGITDAAGNPLLNPPAPGTVQAQAGPPDFSITIDLQPTPVFITSMLAASPDASGNLTVLTGPRSFYEVPEPGFAARADAPPSWFIIDFSNPIQPTNPSDPSTYNPNAIRLVRSANSPTAAPDGDFGDLGMAGGNTGSGYSFVPGTTILLTNSVPGAQFGEPGFMNRLVVKLPAGTTLAADDYRLYIPNTGANKITDIFGNQLDGEFLGNPAPNANVPTSLGVLPQEPTVYQDLLPNGQTRQGLSGDGLAGGAFMTGFTVVPGQSMVNGQDVGNIIYARPDYIDNPSLSSDDPDGSLLKPYPGLAPEAIANSVNGGDLNSAANFGTNFDPRLDRNGSGGFTRSALFAAQQVRTLPGHNGPVVVVALPSATDPTKTFVLQAPAGSDLLFNDASASVPADTMLAFAPGSVLKMRNASLFVQDQGSSLQVLGGPNPNQQVVFTSFLDDSVGGDTDGDNGNLPPAAGDWGGVVLRNFNDTLNGGRTVPLAPGPVDPSNPSQVPALATNRLGISGAQDALSAINFAQVRFGGGTVAQTNGFRFDAITLFNSRPAITNDLISQTGSPTGSAQAAISADLDSFREDDTARGVLVRHTTLSDNGINGILVRSPVINGVVEATDAIIYPNNPAAAGGVQNYTFDSPLPYVLVTRMEVGTLLKQDSGGVTVPVLNRVYIQPGMMFKLQRGAAIEAVTPGASLNIGDRTYINEFDANPNMGPSSPGFLPPTVGDAHVLFTSLFDAAATTSFFDPTTGKSTIIVPAIDTANNGGVNQPTPGNVPPLARWGDIAITSGALLVMDEATVQFGGGSVNTAIGTTVQRDALAFVGANGDSAFGVSDPFNPAFGSRAFVTNNDFFDNQQAAMSVEPNGLLAADPLRPLASGNPFIRGNLLQRNDLNGMEVLPPLQNTAGFTPNLTVDSVWSNTDVTYILRGTIRLNGASPFSFFGSAGFPTPPSSPAPELKPFVTLTLQSALPDTLLANGQRIGRPGESLIVKLLNNLGSLPDNHGNGQTGITTGDRFSDVIQGAGFLVGLDNGVDAPTDPTIDPGALSQIRILGIGGDQTTGQQRVPVIITSLRDDSVGPTVDGQKLNSAISAAALQAFGYTGARGGTAPQPGDGGVIGFGGLMLSDYNLLDPRDGSLIDNADIKYLTRIEQQGGGVVYGTDDYLTKLGITPASQFNTQVAMTVSNSNLAYFKEVGFLAHPGLVALDPSGIRTMNGGNGQPTVTLMYNDTITHMPVGVRIMSYNGTYQQFTNPSEAILLNNTFDADGVSVFLQGGDPGDEPNHQPGHVYALLMDNIFGASGTSPVAQTAYIVTDGRVGGIGPGTPVFSQGQFNLFQGTVTPLIQGGGQFGSVYNGGYQERQPIFGNPRFRNPDGLDYTLLPNSDAIDQARSEIGPLNLGNTLRPIVNQALDGSGGTRNATGRINPLGGLEDVSSPGDIVTLPGEPASERGFVDSWQAAIPGSPGAIPGPTSNAGGTFSYVPAVGERDQAGNLRVKDPNSANVGFGSRPFFDIGANEFIPFNPPKVTGVTAVVPVPGNPPTTTTTNIYAVGSIGGTNKNPVSIQVQFNTLIDPKTLTNATVLLEESGGDGIFGNGNSALDKFIDLSGKLAFDPATKILTISIGASNLVLPNDEYRLILEGSGNSVIRDPNGVALDGENTSNNDDPNGSQLPLPSGDGFPGGNFFVTFSVNSVPPQVNPATPVHLDPATDTNRVGDNITANAQPAFDGSVIAFFPPVNPQSGDTVAVDVSTKGDGNFDIVNAGIGTTRADGTFTVKVSQSLPNSPYNVGPDGILGTADDTGYSVARIRVVDKNGNQSNPNDPNALVRFVVDTTGARILSASPTPGSAVTPGGGVVPVTVAVDKNIDPTSLNPTSIVVARSGGDGIFGNGNDVPVQIDPNSVAVRLVGGSPKGAEVISFNVTGVTANDVYQVTLKGTGASTVHDIAGNPISGAFSGQFPTGNGVPGSDFNLQFIVLNPALSRTVFVSANAFANGDGSRGAPFQTIAAGLAAAGIGDTVAVLPGVYTTNVTLKSLVHLVSASPASSNGLVLPGNPLLTIIRSPATGTGSGQPTVSATNLVSIPGFATELGGFTIASPVNGTSFAPNTIGVQLTNSSVLLDRNYIIDASIGVVASTSGAVGVAPIVANNGIIGNQVGLLLNDTANSLQSNSPDMVLNNTFAFNDTGLVGVFSGQASTEANIANNIFYENAPKTAARGGAAIFVTTPGKSLVSFNLFQGNGTSDSNPSDDVINVGGAFNPGVLKATAPDVLGNFTGNPAFARPIDPRPNADGPNNFFPVQGDTTGLTGASFDLTAASAAVDNANNGFAPLTDFLSRGRVKVTGRGFPGHGPADVGAFEFHPGGTGSTTASGGATGGGGVFFGTTASKAVDQALNDGGLTPSGGGTAIPAGVVHDAAATSSPPAQAAATSQGTVGSSPATPVKSSTKPSPLARLLNPFKN
jgi:large repetitive protein